MSQDSHETADQDSQRTQTESVRFDKWPVEGYDGSGDGSPTYVGMAGPIGSSGSGTGGSRAVVYDEDEDTIFEAAIDDERQRLVPEEGTERQLSSDSEDSGDPIGEALEDLGDRFDWDSLSAFARDRLQETDEAEPRTESGPNEIEPEAVSFTRSNVGATADIDMEFMGSFTYRREDGQVFVIERDFEVTFDDPDAPQTAFVDVLERLLRAEEPQEERRTGDAEPLEENTLSFTIELDGEQRDQRVESVVKEHCEKWHESNVQSL